MVGGGGPKPQSAREWAHKFALTGCASMCAESATFPIDMTKTRMQLYGSGASKAEGVGGRVGFFQCGLLILRNEGLQGMYRGVSAAVIRHIPYTGTRVGLYEFLRGKLCEEGQKPPIYLRFVMGFTAGGVAQTIAVPADLVKVRMQADGRLIASGEISKPRYNSFFDALRKITAEKGVAGLWRGTVPAVTRAALVNLGELATYDTAKQLWLESGLVGDNVYCHVLSAICSGFFASLMSTPADVVKTRLMNQPEHGTKLYKGMVDCFVKTARSEGITGLYKGFFPGWGRLGPWQLTFWVTYEQLRIATGYGTF